MAINYEQLKADLRAETSLWADAEPLIVGSNDGWDSTMPTGNPAMPPHDPHIPPYDPEMPPYDPQIAPGDPINDARRINQFDAPTNDERRANAARLANDAKLVFANDDAAASLLNDSGRGYTIVRPILVGDFANWLASRGILRRINDAMSHTNDMVASIACLVTMKIQGDPGKYVDPQDASIQQMMGAFVAVGVVAAQDVAEFTQACSHPCGWFESKTGRICTANDIRMLR